MSFVFFPNGPDEPQRRLITVRLRAGYQASTRLHPVVLRRAAPKSHRVERSSSGPFRGASTRRGTLALNLAKRRFGCLVRLVCLRNLVLAFLTLPLCNTAVEPKHRNDN